MKELKILFKETFGTEITEENFKQVLDQHIEKKTESLTQKADKEIAKLADQLNVSNARGAELESQLKDLQPKAELGSKYLEDERKETVRLYKLAKDNHTSDAILKTLEKADLETIQAFQQEFKKEVEEKFPAKCAQCGSTDISRQSSKEQISEVGEPNKTAVLNQDASQRVRELHSI